MRGRQACVCVHKVKCMWNVRGRRVDSSAGRVCVWREGEESYCIVHCCLVCAEVQTLIIPVWAVWHSGRMCSSLRNSLELLAGEGGPTWQQTKGQHTRARTHTHTITYTLQDKNMHYVNKPLGAFLWISLCECVPACVNLHFGMKPTHLCKQWVLVLLINLGLQSVKHGD